MAFTIIHPEYRDFLRGLGLVAVEHFLTPCGIILSGHPDRNVARVELGAPDSAIPILCKREHRVRWKDRLRSAWAGFGLVSKSAREASSLNELALARLPVPRWIAVGEDDAGSAFLWVREEQDYVDLRNHLSVFSAAAVLERRAFLRRLGHLLAAIHHHGFDHPDLYSKHILVHPDGERFLVVDWQRTRHWRRPVPTPQRCRDLAALDATLARSLVSRSDRLCVLEAYFDELPELADRAAMRKSCVHLIHKESDRLSRKRRIREVRDGFCLGAAQRIIWRDGEALCLTADFQTMLEGDVPGWLPLRSMPDEPATMVRNTVVRWSSARTAMLIQRRRRAGWLEWLRCLFGKRLVSPEIRNACLLFRLQRVGLVTPRLLAFGERRKGVRVQESMLLTEPIKDSIGLTTWLRQPERRRDTRTVRFRQFLRAGAATLRRMHEARCFLSPQAHADVDEHLHVLEANSGPALAVMTPAGIAVGSKHKQQAMDDLHCLLRASDGNGLSRTDRLRFLLGYLGIRRMTPQARKWIMNPVWLAIARPHLRLLDTDATAENRTDSWPGSQAHCSEDSVRG